MAAFTNRPDLLDAATKAAAALAPAMVAAGAATGRVPAPGDVKMVGVASCRVMGVVG